MTSNSENEYLNPFEPLLVKKIDGDPNEEPEVNERLKKMNEKDNNELKEDIKENNIYNKSLKTIIREMSTSMINLIEELYEKPKEEKWNEYILKVLTKDDRMIYIGFLLVIISISIMIII